MVFQKRIVAALFLILPSGAAAGGIAAAGQSIANWPAPASWSPPRSSRGLVALGDVTNPLPFVGVTPCRVADTRGNGFTGVFGPPSIAANATRTFPIAGQCGIPAFAEAVSLNLGVLNVSGAGDLRVFPAGGGVPLVSTLNYNGNTPNIANAAIVPLGSGGAITVQADAVPIDLIIDVNGYYSSSFGTPSNFFSIINDSQSYSIHTKNDSTSCNSACGIYTQIFSTNALGATAIWAQAAGATGPHVGVRGETTTSSGATYGVYGTVASTTGDAAGVRGVDGSGPPPGSTNCCFASGVRGESSDNIGVLGISRNVAVEGRQHDFQGVLSNSGALATPQYGVYSGGNFAATGMKMFVEPHPSDPSRVIRYVSLEGPEAGTYFRARARCADGTARVAVPKDFATVTDDDDLSVQATAIGKLANFAVERLDLTEVVLACSRDVEVFVTVNGIRRAFRDHQPVADGPEFMPESPAATMPGYLAEEAKRRLVANGTYNADGTVNLETAERLGWTRAWKEREAAGRRAASHGDASKEHP